MTDRINGVPISGIVDFIESGIRESQRVAIRNSLVDDEGYEDELSKFANRMTVRLNTAIKRIQQLEKQAVEDSWRLNPDRMGGQFTQEELNRYNQDRW